MRPSKPLPSAILSAIGLASTGCDLLGPCLDYTACLDYMTYPTATTGDTGSVGPCLDYATTPTGDTGSTTPVVASPPTHVPTQGELLEMLSSDGTLPTDVARRLAEDVDE